MRGSGIQVIVNNTAINYSVQGQGPELLFIHGWGDKKSTFTDVVKALSPKFTCISLDLPGFGDSQTPEDNLNLDDYASYVESFLVKIDKTKLVGVVGHSIGGAIAIKLASRGNVDPKRLVLLASAGIRTTEKLRKSSLGVLAKIIRIPLALLPQSLQRRIKKAGYEKIGSELYLMEHLQRSFKNIVSEDLESQAKSVGSPTLLVYGDEDPSTPVVYGEMYKSSIKDSKLEVIAGADHFLHQSHSGQVVKLLKGFLG